MKYALFACALVVDAIAQQFDCVNSSDSSVRICLDGNGQIVNVTLNGMLLAGIAASNTLVGCTVSTATVSSNGVSVSVQRNYTLGSNSATVVDTFSPGSRSIMWDTLITSADELPFSAPIQTTFDFNSAAANLKLWSTWDRNSEASFPGSWVDPLQPSDVMQGGWWTGGYKLGNVRGASDYITAPLWAVLSTTRDAGLSLHLSPEESPMDIEFNCYEDGSLTFTRSHYRMSARTPVRLHQDIVGHTADWRSALAWSVNAYSAFWEPENVDTYLMAAGTGSYSSYLGTINVTDNELMGYAANWDLSGRFFPYMGMFLPPLTSSSEQWLCDPEGSQPVINVTFDLIGQFYRYMATSGFLDLSYFNVNEYGLNIVLPKEPAKQDLSVKSLASSSPVTEESLRVLVRRELGLAVGDQDEAVSCADDWQNASACFISDLLPALVTHSYNTDDGRVMHSPYYSWQNAVVVDPGVEEYHSFMLEQMTRHIVWEDAFMGVAIDRSDWQDLYNCGLDDGVSFVPEAVETGVPGADGICSSMRISYARMVRDLRSTITLVPGIVRQERAAHGLGAGPSPVGNGIMLLNRYGNGRLDQFRNYDGLFSEGMAVNGAGLIAVATPAILWTYDWTSCCSSDELADRYFQAHIYMGLCPMLPFPGNDHAIPYNATAAAFYKTYAPLLKAIAPKVWLLESHIVAVHNGTGSGFAKVNAFVVPVISSEQNVRAHEALTVGQSAVRAAAPAEQAVVFPVVFASDPAGTVVLNITGIDRAWGEGSLHPLLRAYRKDQGITGAVGIGAGTTYTAEVLWPGSGWAWSPLGTSPSPDWLLTVPVVQGAAVLRIRAVASR